MQTRLSRKKRWFNSLIPGVFTTESDHLDREIASRSVESVDFIAKSLKHPNVVLWFDTDGWFSSPIFRNRNIF